MSPDIVSSQSKTPPFDTLQYRIRRGRPQLVTRASNNCVHGMTRSVCKTCDPVGYKISRIRGCVAGGLKRVGVVKCKKTLQYLGVPSFDKMIQHFQRKMDVYNAKNPQGLQMTFDNIHIDHIKPAKAFGDEINHYTNLQPLLPATNRCKKARWSAIDELFWHENIKNNSDYVDIYLGACEHVDITQEKYLTQAKPKAHTAPPNMTKDELRDELLLWQDDKPTGKSEYFDSILSNLRSIPNFSLQSDDIDSKEVAFRVSAKSVINQQIARLRELGQTCSLDRVNSIFLNDATFKSNQNMVLAMYTLEKIKRMQAHAATLDYALPNAKTVPACVCLLHELVDVFNADLHESARIKVSDLSLHQNQYDEGEEIEITDEMWGLFSYNCRAIKKRPSTRRDLMTVIFTLAQKIFGKWFTDKKKTRSKNVKNKTNCYNYIGNHRFVSVYVRLADWSKHDLSDFEPAMVSKYKLEARQRRDVSIYKQIRDAYDPVKIKQKEDDVERKRVLLEKKEDEMERERALLSSEPPPKRHKTSKTDALSQKELVMQKREQQAYMLNSQQEFRMLREQKQEQRWLSDKIK